MSDFPKILMLFMFHASMDRSNGAICQGSVMNNGTSCPKNQTEWDRAARELNCEALSSKLTCSPESKLVYHCLLNQWSNGTVEVCASPWYISGYCAMFSVDEKRIKNNFSLDCTDYIEPCPSRYISTNAYKYQHCYDIEMTETEKSNKSNADMLLIHVLVVVAALFLLVVLTVVAVLCFKRKQKNTKAKTKRPEEKTLVDHVKEMEVKQSETTYF